MTVTSTDDPVFRRQPSRSGRPVAPTCRPWSRWCTNSPPTRRRPSECHITRGNSTPRSWAGTRPVRSRRRRCPDDRPLGFSLWFLNFSTWEGCHGISLRSLRTADARAFGAGRALLSTLAAICVERGTAAGVVVLDTDALTGSRAFYRRIGARELREWVPWRVEGEALPTRRSRRGDTARPLAAGQALESRHHGAERADAERRVPARGETSGRRRADGARPSRHTSAWCAQPRPASPPGWVSAWTRSRISGSRWTRPASCCCRSAPTPAIGRADLPIHDHQGRPGGRRVRAGRRGGAAGRPVLRLAGADRARGGGWWFGSGRAGPRSVWSSAAARSRRAKKIFFFFFFFFFFLGPSPPLRVNVRHRCSTWSWAAAGPRRRVPRPRRRRSAGARRPAAPELQAESGDDVPAVVHRLQRTADQLEHRVGRRARQRMVKHRMPSDHRGHIGARPDRTGSPQRDQVLVGAALLAASGHHRVDRSPRLEQIGQADHRARVHRLAPVTPGSRRAGPASGRQRSSRRPPRAWSR